MMRIPAGLACAVLISAGLSSCALLEGVGGSDFDDALELVPGDATYMTFTHREASAERRHVADVRTGASQDELDAYAEAATEADAFLASTEFAAYLMPMAEKAAFSELDIVWEATATADEGLWRMYKMTDDLDLDDVGDDLVDVGFTEDELAGHRHFSVDPDSDLWQANGLIGEAYPAPLMVEVVVVPDEHLMLTASSPESLEALVDVLEDDADSATDSGDFDEVAEGVDDPELAVLSKAPCSSGDRLTSDQVKKSGIAALGSPEVTAFFITGEETETITRLGFPDDDAAQSDLEAREDYLDNGVLLQSGQPIADVADRDIERDGSVVRIDYEYDSVNMAVQAANLSDGFHACNPG